MENRDAYRSLNLEGLRDAVMNELATQFSRENLSMEEYDERCGKAAKTASRTDLMGLVDDLPLIELPRDPASAEGRLPSVRGSDALSPGGYRLNAGLVPEQDTIFNIFSGTDRKGLFKAPRAMHVLNVFGGSDIDLSQAYIPPGTSTINVVCVFGGCDIKLPEGVNVDVRGIGVFGGFSRRARDADDPSAPTIRVNGIAVFGGCDVRTKRA